MNHFTAARAAALGSTLLACLLTGACGGAGDGSITVVAASAESSEQAASRSRSGPRAPAASTTASGVLAPQAYVVKADELMTNGDFSRGLNNWVTSDAVLGASQARAGGQVMRVAGQATQVLGDAALTPGRSYSLVVRARKEADAGSARLAITFRRPQGSEVFRIHSATVSSTTEQDYTIDFTAPAYAAMAEISVVASDTRVAIDHVSLKQRSALVQTEPVASTAGSYVPTGYALAFNDEFNGTELNRSKWFTRYIYSGTTLDRLGDEKQRYRDNGNHEVTNGVLSLTARKVSSNDPYGVDYESGMIRSDWTARYGYYEARVKMPAGVGVWPAFWLVSDVDAAGKMFWPPEIDIFEFVNNGVEDRLDMIHSNVVTPAGLKSELLSSDPAFDATWTYYLAPFNFASDWHTVGAEWDATSVTMFIDGKKIYTRRYAWSFPDGSLAGPAHILLNLAIGGAWAGRHGIDETAFPQSLKIDWVRAHQKAY